MLISLATTYQWPLHQLDIKNALLDEILDEEVYMGQHPDFVAQGRYGEVCKLKKSSYGQEPNLDSLHQLFRSLIFLVPCYQKNHSVFFRQLQRKRILMMILWMTM